MKLLSAFILSLLLAAPAMADSWPFDHTLLDSIVDVRTDQGSCTGWSINQPKHLYITAFHCASQDGKGITVDHTPSTIVWKDEKADLMVLIAPGVDRPAMRIATHDPAVGDEVASIGFGYDLDHALVRVSHISDVDEALPGAPGRFVVIDAAFAPGQSGGPVVDRTGSVVMIVQAGNDRLGIGRSAKDIRDKIGRYLK